jgi:hypothetical protein
VYVRGGDKPLKNVAQTNNQYAHLDDLGLFRLIANTETRWLFGYLDKLSEVYFSKRPPGRNMVYVSEIGNLLGEGCFSVLYQVVMQFFSASITREMFDFLMKILERELPNSRFGYPMSFLINDRVIDFLAHFGKVYPDAFMASFSRLAAKPDSVATGYAFPLFLDNQAFFDTFLHLLETQYSWAISFLSAITPSAWKNVAHKKGTTLHSSILMKIATRDPGWVFNFLQMTTSPDVWSFGHYLHDQLCYPEKRAQCLNFTSSENIDLLLLLLDADILKTTQLIKIIFNHERPSPCLVSFLFSPASLPFINKLLQVSPVHCVDIMVESLNYFDFNFPDFNLSAEKKSKIIHNIITSSCLPVFFKALSDQNLKKLANSLCKAVNASCLTKPDIDVIVKHLFSSPHWLVLLKQIVSLEEGGWIKAYLEKLGLLFTEHTNVDTVKCLQALVDPDGVSFLSVYARLGKAGCLGFLKTVSPLLWSASLLVVGEAHATPLHHACHSGFFSRVFKDDFPAMLAYLREKIAPTFMGITADSGSYVGGSCITVLCTHPDGIALLCRLAEDEQGRDWLSQIPKRAWTVTLENDDADKDLKGQSARDLLRATFAQGDLGADQKGDALLGLLPVLANKEQDDAASGSKRKAPEREGAATEIAMRPVVAGEASASGMFAHAQSAQVSPPALKRNDGSN